MATYVVDTSVVIQRPISDTYTPNVRALFRSITQSDQLIVPEFCLMECANVLWKQVRFYGIPPVQAKQLARDLRGLPLRRAAVKRLLDDALQIGLTYQLAIYDAIYIALAKRLSAPLITTDQPQTRAGSAEGVTLKPIVDFTP